MQEDIEIREKLNSIIIELLERGIASVGIIRRDGVPIVCMEKKTGSTNWKAISVISSSFMNHSEIIGNEMYKGNFETSILETDYERIVVAKITPLCLMFATIPKEEDYTLEMLAIMKAVKSAYEILK